MHLYLSGSPIRSPVTKNGESIRSLFIPAWTEGLHTMGCGLVPQGDRFRHCNLYPSAMQPSARYLPPWLGWTRAPLASLCRSNPHQGVPSTTVTTSHVTQGSVEFKSTIPRSADKGLDLWEAYTVHNMGSFIIA